MSSHAGSVADRAKHTAGLKEAESGLPLVSEPKQANSFKCRDAPINPLLPLSDHTYALHRLMSEPDFAYSIPGLTPAADWLILAAGLRDVSIVTIGLDYQDVYCLNTYEESRGAAASAVATTLARHLFVWGAAEVLMKPVFHGQQKDESPIKMLSRKVDGATDELVHHDCASRHLFDGLEDSGFDDEFSDAAQKARKFDVGMIGQATLAAYHVRNKLAHGAVPWPHDDKKQSTRGVFVGESACRVLLFAVQRMLMWLVPPDAEIIDWPSDEDWDEDEDWSEGRRRLISAALLDAHLGT